MNDVTVILNGYIRPQFLPSQIEAINNQTIQPTEIMLWQNTADNFNQNNVNNITTAVCSKNLGVWARFAYALNAKTKYVCIFDDDTVPGKKWLENCLNTMSTHRGLLGTIGLLFDNTYNYLPHRRYGWDFPIDEPMRVDIVGHSWFFEREWLSAFWRELPPPNICYVGEDMHFSYTIQKYLSLNTYVPPHPANDRDMWGSVLGWQYGTVNPTSAIPGRMAEMNYYYNHLINNGFKIVGA